MTSSILIKDLEKEIRAVKQSAPADLQCSIETYLEDKLQNLALNEKIALLEQLAWQFKNTGSEKTPALEFQSQEFTRLVSLLLGKKISISDLSSAEISEKLAQSLNTVFDMLNQIIGVINATLLGQGQEQETIRLIIGAHIGGKEGDNSLQNYLGQIQEAFLVAHKASAQAAETMVRQILSGLNPEAIATSVQKGFRIWLLSDAKSFDLYKEKYRMCKEWVESGRLSGDFLREFEKTCQKLYKTETRRS